MECNKAEAKKALDIAEIKLSENDYVGAKKFSEKAKNLYPQLDGLKQVLMMINVYMIASKKINGIGDWYGILGVDPLANDEIVKKQYKKLALLLHPDKNKRKGAEGAFKLVSEAWCLLSDKVQRSAYDQKRKFGMQKPLNPQKPASGMGKPAYSSGNYNAKHGVDPKAKAKGNKHAPSGWNIPKGDMFWTMCNNCNIQFAYLKEYHLNKGKRCSHCGHTFIATEKTAPWTSPFPPKTNRNTNGDSSATPKTQEASTKSQEATNKNTKANASPQASTAQNQPMKKTKKGKSSSFKFCGPSINVTVNVPQGASPTCTDSSSSQPQQQGSTQNQSTSQNTSGGTRDTSASASFSFNWSCPYSGMGIYKGGNVTNQAQGRPKRALEKPQEHIRFKKPRTEVI